MDLTQILNSMQDGHGSGLPLWLQILIGAALLALKIWGIPVLNAIKARADADAASIKIDMQGSLLGQRGAIAQLFKDYAESKVVSLMATNMPLLAQRIQRGDFMDVDMTNPNAPAYHVSKAKVKAELYAWGDTLKADVVTYFDAHGIDVVKVLGEKFMDDCIDAIVSKYSAFPGLETAAELTKTEVIPLLLNNGFDWVRKYYLGTLPASELLHAGVSTDAHGTPVAAPSPPNSDAAKAPVPLPAEQSNAAKQTGA